MKSKNLLRGNVLLLCMLLASLHLYSQSYYLASAPGYAAGTTGGGTPSSSNIITVTNSSQLLSALTGSRSVIIVSGTITTARLNVIVANKTIIGLPGAKLVNLNQTASGSGILHLQEGSNNVIIRNLKFEGPGAYDVDGWDLLTNKGCDNLWVDHCSFQDGVDCLFDNSNNSDKITVTWCKFFNTKPPLAGGPGGSDDHRFGNLIGGGDSDAPSDGRYSITWAYNWWGDNIKSRMVRARNSQLHILNCYWNSQIARANIGLTAGTNGTTVYVEGGVFECTGTILDYNSGCSVVFDGCIGGASNVGSVSTPSYSYSEISVNSVKGAVTNASCGAGATLQVSSAGVVSSSCNGGGGTVTELVIQENEAGFCSVNGTVDNNNAGYSGTGFANTTNAAAAGINWSVNIPSSGSYILRWTYANGAGATRPGSVKVNGTMVATLIFTATTNWTTWAENSSSTVTVNLTAGIRTIRLEATTAGGLANIDKIKVEGINPLAVSCGSSARLALNSEEVAPTLEGTKIYPNPASAGGKLTIQLSEKASMIEIFDFAGTRVRRQPTGTELIVEMESPATKGLYLLKIYTGNGVRTEKLLIQ